METLLDTLTSYGLNVAGAFAILIAGYIIAGWIARVVKKRAQKSHKIDPTLAPVLVKVTRITILVFTFVAMLNQFGVQTASLVAVLGAAGLAIGLALQGTLSNIASGVMLLIFRPFNVGDTVEIGNSKGVVDEIGLFMTKMHTPDNIFFVMPNSKVWGQEIKNYSRNDTRRIDLVFGIGYDDDMDKAMNIIKAVFDKESRILTEPEPLIAVGELADSSVNILARPWTKAGDYWQTRLDLTRRIKERFDAEDISIPYPQRDLHIFQDQANSN